MKKPKLSARDISDLRRIAGKFSDQDIVSVIADIRATPSGGKRGHPLLRGAGFLASLWIAVEAQVDRPRVSTRAACDKIAPGLTAYVRDTISGDRLRSLHVEAKKLLKADPALAARAENILSNARTFKRNTQRCLILPYLPGSDQPVNTSNESADMGVMYLFD